MIKPLKRLLLIATLLISTSSYSQDSIVVSDFELWTGIGLQKSFLEDKLTMGLTQEFRFNDNSTRINNFFTEVTAKYELIDGLRLGGGFRFIRNNRNSGYRNESRLFGDLSYRHKLDRLTFDYRFRFQNQSALGDVTDDDVYNKFRLRLKVKYNIPNWKLDPALSVEGFYTSAVNNINYVPSITISERAAGFEKIRFTLGTSYKINKWLKIDGFYRIEREFGSFPLFYDTPATYYIAGINLTFKL
jgi:hypothetical protein